MLYLKAAQIVSITPVETKAYDFVDDDGDRRAGTTIQSLITAMTADGRVAIISVRAKSEAEVKAKVAAMKLTNGQPAEIRVEANAKMLGGVMQLRA